MVGAEGSEHSDQYCYCYEKIAYMDCAIKSLITARYN